MFNDDGMDRLPLDGQVFILEGRPNLESSQYLVKELSKRKIKPILIADNMAGYLCMQKKIQSICIAYESKDNENVLTPIGGLILAVLGKKHKIAVNVYPGQKTKKLLGVQKDLTHFMGVRVAPKGVKGYAPLVENVSLKYIRKCYE